MNSNYNYIDISMTYSKNMIVFEGDPPFDYEYTNSIINGNICNTWKIVMGSHSGTHFDAPLHFIRDGKSVDQVPLDYFIGKTKVIKINNNTEITDTELQRFEINEGDRIMFKTKNSDFPETDIFRKDYVYVSPGAAKYLVDKKVRTIGVDYLSVEQYGSQHHYTHKCLLENGVIIIEGLRLKNVEEGIYTMIGCPINLKGGNGSPIRVLLQKDY